MKALLKKADCLGYSERKHIGDLAGTWVTIETKHLFDNQYNTVEGNLRIMDGSIERIVNDARINKGKCRWCGTIVEKGKKCPKYRSHERIYQIDSSPNECDEYGVKWFSPKNCYFLAHPTGYRHMLELYRDLPDDGKKLGSYTLTLENDWFTLRNSRKNFKFKYDGVNFILYSTCGFYMKKRLDVPQSVHTKLINILTTGVKN